MLNSLDHGETTTPAVPRDGRPERIATDLDVICRRHAAGVDFRKLPAGTKVLVDTSNSRYRFVKLEGHASRALAQGGRCADRSAAVRIEGSTMGGSVLRIGWIG